VKDAIDLRLDDQAKTLLARMKVTALLEVTPADEQANAVASLREIAQTDRYIAKALRSREIRKWWGRLIKQCPS
jgi:hypothetical protein